MGKRGPRHLQMHQDVIVHWYGRLRSTRAVAEQTGFSRGKVIRYLRRAGVEVRPAGRPKKTAPDSNTGSS